jgi:hypothetical protein
MKRTPKTTKRAAATVDVGDGDAKFAAVVAAFAADPRLAAVSDAYAASQKRGGRKFGSNGLKVGGKLFALFVRGALVVKLSKARVDALVASGAGRPFETGPGRKMKEWVVVASPKLSWVDLAREAHDFVKGLSSH